ncbi:MAG: hypothetical protein JJ831_08100 [Prochlorococcus marinus XMU1422]|nr:hypothetical protein [Prochlorococcus marinus XMU1421]MBO7013262.1 hypothetical protein [Prochlorococcus marinus XMU1422]MCR8542283.1 hypothetical protein [Prochlorococcus marinus XMU1423]
MGSITIQGSGFGLYGYLPAIIDYGYDSLLLDIKKREFLEKRNELIPFIEKIIWVDSIKSIFETVDSVVIAVPPNHQPNLVYSLLNFKNIKNLHLEKPLGKNPDDSEKLSNFLYQNDYKWHVNYSFIYSNWFDDFKEKFSRLDNLDQLKIIWKFKSFQLRNKVFNWKTQFHSGGGPLNFYGIHLVALLAYFGYEDIIYSSINKSIWIATFLGDNIPNCKIFIDIDSDEETFAIDREIGLSKKINLINFKNPFINESIIENQDIRCSLLKKFLYKSDMNNLLNYSFEKKVNNLWIKAIASY